MTSAIIPSVHHNMSLKSMFPAWSTPFSDVEKGAIVDIAGATSCSAIPVGTSESRSASIAVGVSGPKAAIRRRIDDMMLNTDEYYLSGND